MKLRLVAALASMLFLVGVAVFASTAGPLPASWERQNPASCPFPRENERPPCLDLPVPSPGVRPVPVAEVKS